MKDRQAAEKVPRAVILSADSMILQITTLQENDSPPW
jgi:hypothetical protein